MRDAFEKLGMGALLSSVVLGGVFGNDEAALPLAWLAGLSFVMKELT